MFMFLVFFLYGGHEMHSTMWSLDVYNDLRVLLLNYLVKKGRPYLSMMVQLWCWFILFPLTLYQPYNVEGQSLAFKHTYPSFVGFPSPKLHAGLQLSHPKYIHDSNHTYSLISVQLGCSGNALAEKSAMNTGIWDYMQGEKAVFWVHL